MLVVVDSKSKSKPSREALPKGRRAVEVVLGWRGPKVAQMRSAAVWASEALAKPPSV